MMITWLWFMQIDETLGGYFFIMQVAQIYTISHACLPIRMVGQLSCVVESFLLDATQKLFNLPCSDFYHFISLSVALTLTMGQKLSRKQNLVAFFSCTLLNWLE